MKSHLSLDQQIAGLPKLAREDLCKQYEALHQRVPPARLSRNLLELAIAYRLQEQLVGRLRSNIRRALTAGEMMISTLAVGGAGTVLIREWHGRHYSVTVTSRGVSYNGAQYKSLSEVARHITGHRCSGPAFFGLKKHGQ